MALKRKETEMGFVSLDVQNNLSYTVFNILPLFLYQCCTDFTECFLKINTWKNVNMHLI